MSRGEEPGEVNVRPVFVCFEISPFLFLCLFSSVLKVRPVSFLGEPCYCTYNKEVIDTSRMEDYGEYVEEEEEEIMEVVGKVLQR